MTEGTRPKVRAYLSLASDRDLLSEVTSLLGEPDRFLKKGSPIHSANPDRIYTQNVYQFGQIESIRSLDVPALVAPLVGTIEGKEADLVALNLEVQLSIVVQFNGGETPILNFPREVIATLHSVGGSLDIDAYS
jgi:hypothetical protein